MNGLLVCDVAHVGDRGWPQRLTVGFVCGLVGGVISMEYNLTGFTGLLTAMLAPCPWPS